MWAGRNEVGYHALQVNLPALRERLRIKAWSDVAPSGMLWSMLLSLSILSGYAQTSRCGFALTLEHTAYESVGDLHASSQWLAPGAFIRYGFNPGQAVRVNFGLGWVQRSATGTLRFAQSPPGSFASITTIDSRSIYLDAGIAVRGIEREKWELRYLFSVQLSGVQRAKVQVQGMNGPAAFFEKRSQGSPEVSIRPGLRFARSFGGFWLFSEAGYGFVIKDDDLGEEGLGQPVRSYVPERKSMVTLCIGAEVVLGTVAPK